MVNIISKGFETSDLLFVSELILKIMNDIKNNSGHSDLPPLTIQKSPFGHPRFECHKKYSGELDFRIFVDPADGDILEWIGQFSHEYIHLILSFKGIRALHDRLLWFEESLCHAHTLFQIDRLCRNPEIPGFHSDDEWPLRGLNTTLPQWIRQESVLKNLLQSGYGVYDYQSQLQPDNPCFCNYYASIAAVIYPFFQNNPSLWGILRHLQNCKESQDLKDVLLYCRKFANESYVDSLDHLIMILLGLHNVKWKFAD